MAFTTTQQAKAAQDLQEVIDRLTSARTSLLAASGTQFVVTFAVKASIDKLIDVALVCGGALED